MKFWASFSAGVGAVAVIVGVIWIGLYLMAIANDPTVRPAEMLAHIGTQFGGIAFIVGLILCGLGGIETALREILAELRKRD